ncbi:discoidin domain-containing protein [Streptomyces sp. NPDC059454]|uniref:discoidin domain-containing protein n=1 Tax=Streptomyces sp. NPDC059454 TaxID=3346836 RepID=UPI003687B535
MRHALTHREPRHRTTRRPDSPARAHAGSSASPHRTSRRLTHGTHEALEPPETQSPGCGVRRHRGARHPARRPGPAAAADTPWSQGKPATASSAENAGTPASGAVDGDTGTRWSSAASDDQWLQVDLGATASVTRVVLNREAAITHDGIVGYAACKVADPVDEHEAWALGSHCTYTSDDTIVQHHGFQVPVKPGIRMRHLQVISLGGKGQYRHVIDDPGSPASGTDTVPSKATRFP